jgi:carboxymethylenebutenolidase
MGTTIELTAADGHQFSAYRATPSGKARGAVIVVQEVFGVNAHIRRVTDDYAADGYVAIAPAMYDRVERGYESGYTQPEIAAGVAIMQKLDWSNTLQDIAAAVAEAGKIGKTAIVGFCWGGTVAWRAASATPGLAASVAYYPGGIANFADQELRCPVMCHFGEMDKSPTPEAARAVVAKHPSVEAFFYPAGHGFNCDQRPSFDVTASSLARTRTLDFLARHLGS